MRGKVWLTVFLCLIGVSLTWAAPPSPFLHYMVQGGEEVFEVTRTVDLSRVAQEKGVRWEILAQRNSVEKPFRLKPGMSITIDNTHIIPTELSHGLVINLPELQLYHFHQGAYQRRYSLGIGRRNWETPVGDYYIINKARKPTWIVPTSIQSYMAARGQELPERVPPGPQNPLGDYWLGTSAPGVGLHATNRPWTVGNLVSHGCLRMLPDEIAQLFPLVEVGSLVKIIYQPVKMAFTPQGKIYLEAHPDVYGKKFDGLAWVESLLDSHQLHDRIDWHKAMLVLKSKTGIAQDVTKSADKPSRLAVPEPKEPRQLGLFPLQPPETRVD